jgi:hypothetical protein
VSPGERRRRARKRERDRIAYEAEMNPLRDAGASCGSCASFKRGSNVTIGADKHYCAAESDFEGYVIVRADGLCPKHRALSRPAPEAREKDTPHREAGDE